MLTEITGRDLSPEELMRRLIGTLHDLYRTPPDEERQSARRRAARIAAHERDPEPARRGLAAVRAAQSRDADERYARFLELDRRGWSRARIARELGVSTTSVGRYEKRRQREVNS